MSLCAVSVRELAAAWVTAAFTLMSPLPAVDASVAMATLVVSRLLARVVAPMPLVVCAPEPALMVKSIGSSSHWPAFPFGANEFTPAVSATRSVCPEVSTRPPWPLLAPPCA